MAWIFFFDPAVFQKVTIWEQLKFFLATPLWNIIYKKRQSDQKKMQPTGDCAKTVQNLACQIQTTGLFEGTILDWVKVRDL